MNVVSTPVTMSTCSSASSDSETEEAAVHNEDEQEEEKDIDDTDGVDGEEQGNIEEAEEDLISADDQFTTIMALPPKALSFEENHMEVSASPAFHILDAVSRRRILFL